MQVHPSMKFLPTCKPQLKFTTFTHSVASRTETENSMIGATNSPSPSRAIDRRV